MKSSPFNWYCLAPLQFMCLPCSAERIPITVMRVADVLAPNRKVPKIITIYNRVLLGSLPITSNTNLWYLFVVNQNELLNKQAEYRWYKTAWCSPDATAMILTITLLQWRIISDIIPQITWKSTVCSTTSVRLTTTCWSMLMETN